MNVKSVKEALAKIIVTGKNDAKLESNYLDLSILSYLGRKGEQYCSHINAAIDGVALTETTRSVGGRLKALETAGYATKRENDKNGWIYWNVTPAGKQFLSIFEKKGEFVANEAAMDAAHEAEFAKKPGKKGEKKAKVTVDLSAFEEDEAPVAAGVDGDEQPSA